MKVHKLYSLQSVVFALNFLVIEAEEHLRYAAVVFRHGDRTPTDPYPNDPYRNESLWPVKFGQLTNTGKAQHFKLGQWLRGRYPNLVSTRFDPAEIYVQSTDVDRTLMSALANLAGFFPPAADSIWNKDLAWQPIPVHTVPERSDNIIAMKKPCKAYDVEYKRVIQSAEYKERLSKYQPLMDYLSAHTGLKVRGYVDIDSIYSDLLIEHNYNFTLPEWTKLVFPDQMLEPAGYSFTMDTSNTLLARLKIGPLIKEIVGNMMKTANYHNYKNHNAERAHLFGKKPKKLNIYSGHDLTVGSILNALGLYDGICPTYTATVFFELFYDDAVDTHFVQISYRNSIDIVEPDVLNIPKCGTRCPLERFAEIYKDIMPADWNEECNKKFPLVLVLTGSVSVLFGIGLYIWHISQCAKSHDHRRRNSVRYFAVRPAGAVLKPAAI